MILYIRDGGDVGPVQAYGWPDMETVKENYLSDGFMEV